MLAHTHYRAKFALFGSLIAVGLIAFQGASAAHHPEIAARAVCVPTDTARITLDVAAWADSSPERRTHNDVVVTLTAPSYSQTFHRAFSPSNNFSFTITVNVPADGQTYTAVASTNEFWGPNGEIVVPVGPQSRSTTVTAPTPCPSASASTTVPPTTVPPNTNPPTTSTTVGVSVQGAVQTAPTTTTTTITAPTTTAGTAVQGVVLARTGTNSVPFALTGLMLLAMGIAIEAHARRRRHA